MSLSTDSVLQVQPQRSGAVQPYDPDADTVLSLVDDNQQASVNSSLVQQDGKNTVRISGPGTVTLLDGTKIGGPVFSLHPETLRLTAYVCFWIMVLVAYISTTAFVDEDLENSPLVKMFGYNNVCIFWDYEPARSITAMFYPCVEVPLFSYVILNFLRCRESYHSKKFTPWRFGVVAVMLPVQIVFVLWFRMIFVVDAFNDTKGHTLGFHGLMIALVLVAIENFLYYDAVGGLPGPRWASIGYLVVLASVTAFKMTVAWSVFAGTPLWSISTVAGQRAGHFLDISWMVLASVIPAILAYKCRQTTQSMVIMYGAAPPGVKG